MESIWPEIACRPEKFLLALWWKNYLLCFFELGAHYISIFYSLLLSARQLVLNPREYLIDVLTIIAAVPTDDQMGRPLPIAILRRLNAYSCPALFPH